MANVSIHQLLGYSAITRVMSRIKTPMARLQRGWGFNPGGVANNDLGGERFGWDIFDRTRHIANGRPFGSGPGTRAPQKVGHVTASAYRSHEQLPLQESRLFRTRAPGSQWGSVDTRGQRYVFMQERHLAQGFRNAREFLTSRMMRGQFDVLVQGDDWIPVDSGGTFTVDFRIPAGNKNQCNALGAGNIIDVTWTSTGTADIAKQVMGLNAASEQLSGYPIRDAWLNSTTAIDLLNNTSLRNAAGTANRVFTVFTPTGLVNQEGIEDTGYVIVFEGIPWMRWNVYDGVLDVNGTTTPIFPTGFCAFTPNLPNVDIAEWYNGSEIVAENVMAPGTERFGFSGWATRTIDPAGFQLKGLDIGIPALYKPNALFWADVHF